MVGLRRTRKHYPNVSRHARVARVHVKRICLMQEAQNASVALFCAASNLFSSKASIVAFGPHRAGHFRWIVTIFHFRGWALAIQRTPPPHPLTTTRPRQRLHTTSERLSLTRALRVPPAACLVAVLYVWGASPTVQPVLCLRRGSRKTDAKHK